MTPVPLGMLLEQVVGKMGLAARLKQSQAVDLWPRVVGQAVGRQTMAGPVRDRVLLVCAANPVLAHQLSMMEREILQRYRKLLGGRFLRGVHLRIGEIPARVEEEEELVAVGSVPPEVDRCLLDLAARIPDAALAGPFLRAARAWALARRALPSQVEQDFLSLATGEAWPTKAEVERALAAVDPSQRACLQHQAAETLRARILARLERGPGDARWAMELRSDLRRLAMVAGVSLDKSSRELAATILGPEAGASWPEM